MHYRRFFILFVIGIVSLQFAQAQEKTDKWKGFKRLQFSFEGKEARLVMPEKPLPGNPWVWRARFPDWHTETDSILLSEGFHVAFINTANQYGSVKAMNTWDRFYDYLLDQYKLNEKVSLEGVSRGGLFIYAWAKRHPERINCIYAEAPVCDFRSWPGGFGKGKGSADDWERLKEEYGFKSDEDAKLYSDMPIDGLEHLAAAKVPVMHMIGLNDEIVPVEENTLVLIDRYVKLGGPATVVPCTKGKQKLSGHHFPIETPRLVADFIKYNTPVGKEKLNSSTYHQLRGGLRNSLIRFSREKKGRVAFLGGSITYNGGWRDSICNYLQARFPETEFEFIAAGIPSMGSTPAAFRMQRDVLARGPVDLLFEEAAVNDQANGRSNTEQVRAMEGIVRNLRQNNPLADMVLMHFVDPEKMEMYREKQIPPVIQNHEKVAEHYQLPSVNLALEVTERIAAGEFTWENDFKNLHPSPFGQQVYFHSIKLLLEKAWSGGVADDDKMESIPLPESLDPSNYDNGILVATDQAIKGKGWTVIDAWHPFDGKGTREDYVDVPMLTGNWPGGVLKFNFTGNAVGIAVAAGPDAGIIEYSIDGGAWKRQDLFTRWSNALHLPWFYTLDAGLIHGKHSLKIRLVEDKNPQSSGQVCRIRYFFVNKY